MKEIRMNMDILYVINAVLDYKKFIVSDSWVKKTEKFDWYQKTKDYYFSLPLPEGMRKNLLDFNLILRYNSNSSYLDKLNNTEPEDLKDYIWRDDLD